jgi:hypothetical protein
MSSPELSRIEEAVDQLPFSDQLWLMEHLARRIREQSQPSPDPRARELEEMANDPAIQRELLEIEAEFSPTDRDGWEIVP